jgi:phosphoglycolate phosphatase
MNKPPLLVLDLDGTLVDTAGDLIATLNAVLAAEGLPPAAPAAVARMIGHGARAMLATALRAHGSEPEGGRLDTLTARFIDHYAGHLADSSRPFPGAVEALDRFRDAGWRLAVCTNKFERLSRSLLEQLALADRFAVIAGQDTFAHRKPDPRHLSETIAAAGGDPRSSVMVGDSDVDVRTAQAAGVPVVAVGFGYSPLPVRQLGADIVIDRFDDLFDAAAGLLRGREAANRTSS